MPEEQNDNVLEGSSVESSQTFKPVEGSWAPARKKIEIDSAPKGVTAINVENRSAMGALQGFGQLWKKTYRLHLIGVNLSTNQVMKIWKEHFAEFQPAGNAFYLPEAGLEAGKVIFIDSPLPVIPPRYDKPGVVPMTSGVMVMYEDDESFAVMTPEGFPVSGWNNFSVYEDNGDPVAQVQSFERASDPIYEFGFRFMGGAKRQEYIWKHVLTQLGNYLGIQGEVEVQKECLDPMIQWSKIGNVWRNAGIRTTLYWLGTPLRWMRKEIGGSKSR